MEKLKKVTGTWRGSYSYDRSERMPAREPVPFKLVLQQGWFGHFTGTVTEDPNLGMPEAGRIDGYFSSPKIEFTKLMPVCYIGLPDGRRAPLRQFLIEAGHKCDQDIQHPPIIYRGEFSDSRHAQGISDYRAKKIVVGRWKSNRNAWGKRDRKIEPVNRSSLDNASIRLIPKSYSHSELCHRCG